MYGWGKGRSCKWFDHNPSAGICRCRGATPRLKGDTQHSQGYNAYVLGRRECSNDYHKCGGCHKGDIAVAKVRIGSKEECNIHRLNFWSKTDIWHCKVCHEYISNPVVTVDKYPIRQRSVVEKGCTKKFGVNGNEMRVNVR